MKTSDYINNSKYQNKIDSQIDSQKFSKRSYNRKLAKQYKEFFQKNKDIIDPNLWEIIEISEKISLIYVSKENLVTSIQNLKQKYLDTLRENKIKSII